MRSIPTEEIDEIDPPMPSWERRLVIASLAIHVADVLLDVLVLALLASEGFSDFTLGSGFVVFWAWLASSLYISCGAANSDDDDMGTTRGKRCRQFSAFLFNLTQVQIFVEAHRCLFRKADGDYFHTLRLMEAILEAAPNSLVHVYALAHWPAISPIPNHASRLLRISVLVAFLSVSLSFAMFEQKVQARASFGYVFCSALMRFFEIASRTTTLALFATLNYPYGLWCVLILDYVIIVGLTMRHKSVRSSYSLFLSLPLVLISYEPLVWRREDHVVPKDRYYILRGLEFVVMWVIILQQQDAAEAVSSPFHSIIKQNSWFEICAVSWVSSIGFCLLFPFVYRVARRHELSRDGIDDGEFDPLEQGDENASFYSDSDGTDERSDGEDNAAEQLLPGPRAQRDADSGTMDQE